MVGLDPVGIQNELLSRYRRKDSKGRGEEGGP